MSATVLPSLSFEHLLFILVILAIALIVFMLFRHPQVLAGTMHASIDERKPKTDANRVYCKYCGKPNPIDSVFCENCGLELK